LRIKIVLIAALLSVSSLAAAAQREPERAKPLEKSAHNSALLQKARQAFMSAEALESALNEKPEADRTRAEYLKVINEYQRVYLITPHTGYADNALMAIARLYEEIHDNANAIRTLTFMIREYPGTPFKDTAEKDVVRLQGGTVQKTVAVDNIRYWEAQNSVRVVVDITGDVTFNQGDAKGPDRVFIDLSPARLNSALLGKQWPVKSGLLQQIRVGQYDGSTVRVVLDVGAIGRVTSFTLRDPDRLIIDVLGKDVAEAAPVADRPGASAKTGPVEDGAPAPEPTTKAAAKPTPIAKKKVDEPAQARPSPTPVQRPAAVAEVAVEKIITPAKAPNAGTRSLVRSLGLKLSRVVIDAGHGGHDTGSIGPGGYTEKDLVLDVALRLKELIETELGAEVVMTRTDDTFVPLESRTAIANQQEADLFISIHANSSRIRAARGVETYFLNFTSSREALETASRENAASERSIHELQDLVKKIMLRDKVDESRELAQYIQRSMTTRKNAGTDRGVKQAPFVVLIGANMPSILAEVCFISNPQEEKLVKASDSRQAIAQSLFEGVRSYAESLSGTKTAAKTQKIQE
jgi:N-acetylmuramoyl-L-alanine amidase